jgi:hypothetical protein
MSKAPRGFVPYCDAYHCAGDCGLPHNQEERVRNFTDAGIAQERKRLTLAAWDRLEHGASRDAKEKRAEVERLARNRA